MTDVERECRAAWGEAAIDRAVTATIDKLLRPAEIVVACIGGWLIAQLYLSFGQ